MYRAAALAITLLISTTVLADPMAIPDRPNGPGAAARSEYFVTKAGMVMIQKGNPKAWFGLTVEISKQLPPDTSIVAEFENPPAPTEAFRMAVTPDSNGKLVLQSPEFEGLYNNRAYLTRLSVLDKDGKTLSVHEQWIWFGMPDPVLKAMGTKVIK